jgi:methylmalonyl-CoA/ethylmalonyl-CoA epimerase
MDLIEKLDHVAFAVRDKKPAARFLTSVLGATEVMEMQWGDFTFASYLLGSASMLELIYASDPGNFVNRFVDKRGQGVHHLTFKVRSIEEMVEHLRSQGLNPEGIETSDPLWKEAYLPPSEALGTVMQFAEFPEEEWIKIWNESR